MRMHTCSQCRKPATWHISFESKDFKTGRGGYQRNVYACEEHRSLLEANTERERLRYTAAFSDQPDRFTPIRVLPLQYTAQTPSSSRRA